MLVAGLDVDRLRLLNHLEIGSNLVECDFLHERALVVDVDFEGVLVVFAMIVFVGMLCARFDGCRLIEDSKVGCVEWECAGSQGQKECKDQPCQLHFDGCRSLGYVYDITNERIES